MGFIALINENEIDSKMNKSDDVRCNNASEYTTLSFLFQLFEPIKVGTTHVSSPIPKLVWLSVHK